MTNKTVIKSRDEMALSLSGVDLRIIECAEAYLNIADDTNACRNLWEKVTNQMWDKHHVKIDVKKRVIWVKKSVTKAVRFIKDSCKKQENFLNLIGDYITLFNYIPPTSVKAEYYMTKDEMNNRRQTRAHVSKLADKVIYRDEMKSKQTPSKKRNYFIPNEECSRGKNYEHRELENRTRKRVTRGRTPNKSKTESATEKLTKEKILSSKQACLHRFHNYDKQQLENNNLKLDQFEKKIPDGSNSSKVETCKELLCDHLKRKGTNQELRNRCGMLPSGPDRNRNSKMDHPKPLEQPIQSGSSHRNATSPIKPYSSVDNFNASKCSQTDIKNSGALSLLSRTPVYHSFLENGMNGSQEPPAWFKTIFEVYKSEEMWKLQNFYSMHREFVDCESKKLSVLKQIYEKLGK